MPYFVFKVFPPKQLEYIEKYDGYREARGEVRTLREALGENPEHQIKMIFAKNQIEAEHLLKEEREAPPIGDD